MDRSIVGKNPVGQGSQNTISPAVNSALTKAHSVSAPSSASTVAALPMSAAAPVSHLQIQANADSGQVLKRRISAIEQEIVELKKTIVFASTWIKANKSNKEGITANKEKIKLAEVSITAKEKQIIEIDAELKTVQLQEQAQLIRRLKESTLLQPNETSNESKKIQSLVVDGKLVSFKVDQARGRDVRGTFLNLYEQGKYTPGPMATAESTLLPGNTAEVIVLGKKPTFEPCRHYAPQRGEQITDMMAVGAQLTTTVMRAKQVADATWRGFSSCAYLDGGDATSVGTIKYREVLFSTQGNMNFHIGDPVYIPAMVQLAGCRAEPSIATILPNDFQVPSATVLNVQHADIDDQLRNHLLTGLMGEALPSIEAVRSDTAKYQTMTISQSVRHLEQLIQGDAGALTEALNSGKQFIEVPISATETVPVSLQVLFNMQIEMIRNEFKALNHVANGQGFIHTIDPPSIFAGSFRGTGFLSRLQVAAYKHLMQTEPELFKNMKAMGFNDVMDQPIVALMQNALTGGERKIPVVPKSALYQGQNGVYSGLPAGVEGLNPDEPLLVVVHNNGDPRAQHIKYEGFHLNQSNTQFLSLEAVGISSDAVLTTDPTLLAASRIVNHHSEA